MRVGGPLRAPGPPPGASRRRARRGGGNDPPPREPLRRGGGAGGLRFARGPLLASSAPRFFGRLLAGEGGAQRRAKGAPGRRAQAREAPLWPAAAAGGARTRLPGAGMRAAREDAAGGAPPGPARPLRNARGFSRGRDFPRARPWPAASLEVGPPWRGGARRAGKSRARCQEHSARSGRSLESPGRPGKAPLSPSRRASASPGLPPPLCAAGSCTWPSSTRRRP